jgi:aspartate/methionine/tyrosine aminotransferase
MRTFSKRATVDLTINRQADLLDELRAGGARLVDLTQTNPTQAGFTYETSLLVPLAQEGALRYDPAPLGLPSARGAVAQDYARRGIAVPASRVVLTASTSEAYSLLFKLLCDPGDEVLVPVPSYPLFEHLTRLDAVRAAAYPLEPHGAWSIDLDALRSAVTDRTRAVLVVSPNNPTGSFLKRAELESLATFCAGRGLALIGDEVFADYPLHGAVSDRPSVVEQRDALAFSLGGLSKSAGLPQVKLGWIAVGGPAARVNDALERLELICDTYLSVSTSVQLAAPALIDAGGIVRAQIARRIARNLEQLSQRVETVPSIELLKAEGGWSAVLRVPATRSEEQLALELLRDDLVIVHPGYFFDFPHEAFVVVSLLPPGDEFDLGVERVIARVAGDS